MLKRIGAGAAVAWSAPVLLSQAAPAFAGSPPPGPTPTPSPQPCGPATTRVTLVDYEAGAYRYQVVSHGQGAGFEAPGFDESGFSNGQAAFGSGGGCAIQSTVHTNWPINTDILLRKHVTVPRCATDVTVLVAIDNDIVAFWNGTQIGSNIHEGCATRDNFVYAVPAALVVEGDNVLAVRAIDRGGESLVDLKVTALVP
jgi:hypothetical protein